MQQELGPLEEDVIVFTLKEVLTGFNHLHSNYIAYGNMSTHHILFSVSSGSLEVKLDHNHVAIDGLDARTSSGTDINNHIKVSAETNLIITVK